MLEVLYGGVFVPFVERGAVHCKHSAGRFAEPLMG